VCSYNECFVFTALIVMHSLSCRKVLVCMPVDCQWSHFRYHCSSSSRHSALPGIAAPPWVNKILGLQYDLNLNQEQQQHEACLCGATLLHELFLLVALTNSHASRANLVLRALRRLPQEQVV
jgi:hypothetical protein